jgi:WD40 repeat protein
LKIVQFAHEKNVSGMVHLTEGIVVSSSFDGTIKVWNIQNEKLLLDQEATNYLQQCYQPTKNIPILFLNFRTLGSIPLLAAGTADGRLLLWHGESREFR